jgi:hypothetical protein
VTYNSLRGFPVVFQKTDPSEGTTSSSPPACLALSNPNDAGGYQVSFHIKSNDYGEDEESDETATVGPQGRGLKATSEIDGAAEWGGYVVGSQGDEVEHARSDGSAEVVGQWIGARRAGGSRLLGGLLLNLRRSPVSSYPKHGCGRTVNARLSAKCAKLTNLRWVLLSWTIVGLS